MKTTNLTLLEAIDAMKRGECVADVFGFVHRVSYGKLLYYNPDKSSWEATENCYGPCSIVADPSKPKESERLWRAYENAPNRMAILESQCFADYILARVKEMLEERK